MEEEREEGEIVDLNDDIYETIISSDEELDLRQRIEELEAKNSELEKIASISKISDYDLASGSQNFINLVDDDGEDDESYYRLPSKYDYSSYTPRKSRNRRKKTCRHTCTKKSKRHKRRRKTQPIRTKDSCETSSCDEFELDRNELRAALKRNNSPIQSSTLKRKLIGCVADFIKANDDVIEDDIPTNNEIMQLLNKLNIENIAPQNTPLNVDDDNESHLNEQELRLIALKSAIVKKHEARKKRKIIETQPYSPTDNDIVMENAITLIPSVDTKNKDELDNMEISPAVSPAIQDGSLQPIDMELESDDETQRVSVLSNDRSQIEPLPIISKMAEKPNTTSKDPETSITVPVPDETSRNIACVPDIPNQIDSLIHSTLQQQQQEEEEEQALRASLLANLKATKKRTPVIESQPQEKPSENPPVPLEKSFCDEAEQLRKILLSSISAPKQRNSRKPHLLPNPFAMAYRIPPQMPKPQISLLKGALKRIKERDKQNVDLDAVANDPAIELDRANFIRKLKSASDTDSSKQTQFIVTQAEYKESPPDRLIKDIKPKTVSTVNTGTEKQNGIKDYLPISVNAKQPADIANIERKSTELSSKTNVVMKSVKLNGSLIECKTKDVTTVPLVISNKNEIPLVDKNDSAVRTVKVVAQKRSIVEPQIASLNQKENQQLPKPIVTLKTAEDKLVNIAKKAKPNNVKVSKVITTPVEKMVKKMIIQLNNSDSESDDLSLRHRSIEVITNENSYSGVASPASYSFSPSSPLTTIDNKIPDAIQPTNDNFQRTLDEYLKSARTKVEQAKLQIKKPIDKSKSLVSHLPPSSQLEYRNLLKRMALLEKRKSQKMGKLTSATQNPKSITHISVTITNDLCNKPSESDCQKQIAADKTVPLKDGDSEKIGIAENVNSEMQKESTRELETEFSMSTETVLVSADIQKNTPIVPECVQAESAAATETGEPDELSFTNQSHNLQNFSASSQDDVKLLQNTELEYMKHSSSYLVDLNKMSSLVCKARNEKEKQFQLEFELDELKLKIQQLEQDLVQQKSSVSKLYPLISASHKIIMKKRSESLQLNKKCYNIGHRLSGADYKIPDDPKAIIAEKIKSLSSETKLLRSMQKPAVKVIEAPTSNKTTLCASIEANVEAHTSIKTTLCASIEAGNHTTAADITVVTNTNDAFSAEKSVSIGQDLPTPNCILFDIPKHFSMVTQYKSPLDHMKNVDVTNPDSILCPFQLLGQCEDRECTFQHLSR